MAFLRIRIFPAVRLPLDFPRTSGRRSREHPFPHPARRALRCSAAAGGAVFFRLVQKRFRLFPHSGAGAHRRRHDDLLRRDVFRRALRAAAFGRHQFRRSRERAGHQLFSRAVLGLRRSRRRAAAVGAQERPGRRAGGSAADARRDFRRGRRRFQFGDDAQGASGFRKKTDVLHRRRSGKKRNAGRGASRFFHAGRFVRAARRLRRDGADFGRADVERAPFPRGDGAREEGRARRQARSRRRRSGVRARRRFGHAGSRARRFAGSAADAS